MIVEDKDRGIAYGLRYYARGDEGVVFSTWMSHIRKTDPFSRFDRDGMAWHRSAVLGPLVERCPPLIAHATDNERLVFGWAAGEYTTGRQVLHLIYVRSIYRNYGIGSKLMSVVFPHFKSRPIYVTHQGKTFRHRCRSWNLIYNPYMVVSRENYQRASDSPNTGSSHASIEQVPAH